MQCQFETDFCGFDVTGDKTFNFSRVQGQEQGQGPQQDAQGSR
jgi:hypothetical protein